MQLRKSAPQWKYRRKKRETDEEERDVTHGGFDRTEPSLCVQGG